MIGLTEQQVEDLFHYYGHEDLYKRFRTPLFVTGILDDAEMWLLEDFFENFSFDRSTLFDEFRFWYRYYEVSKRPPYSM